MKIEAINDSGKVIGNPSSEIKNISAPNEITFDTIDNAFTNLIMSSFVVQMGF